MSATPNGPGPARLPKVCGLDSELGNFIIGPSGATGTGYAAARALIAEIEGFPGDNCTGASYCGCPECCARRRRNAQHSSRRYDRYDRPADGRSGYADEAGDADGYGSQDWNRRFLATNGGCAYVDLGHLELCVPEVRSARDHVACWHAMLGLARGALERANQKQPPGQRIVALVNNSDGNGNSYGSHLSFLITREAWDNLFARKMHLMLFLASHQVSSMVFTGQGKVGGENGRPWVPFQIAQRADFLEVLSGPQTTFNRPICNTRDEALCGRALAPAPGATAGARLHVISFDNTLCQVSSYLKVGTMQVVLAMIEAGRIDMGLILEDPVAAAVTWSHDPTLGATARLCSGRELTAVELQLGFLEAAKSFVADGGCAGIVPQAGEIVALWEDTLLKLEARAFDDLAPRLDWVLKRSLLERARSQHGLDWRDPAMKHLDLTYSNLDSNAGLYWACERNGLVERVVSAEEIERFSREPPADTRAWTRAMLLRRAGPGRVVDVDWDRVRVRSEDPGRSWMTSERTAELPDPLGHARAEVEALFESAGSLDDVLDRLEAAQAVDVPNA
jgi:Pup amidohydrolase